jgi:hypothetical protein
LPPPKFRLFIEEVRAGGTLVFDKNFKDTETNLQPFKTHLPETTILLPKFRLFIEAISRNPSIKETNVFKESSPHEDLKKLLET